MTLRTMPYTSLIMYILAGAFDILAVFSWGKVILMLFRNKKGPENAKISKILVGYSIIGFWYCFNGIFESGYMITMWRPSKVILKPRKI